MSVCSTCRGYGLARGGHCWTCKGSGSEPAALSNTRARAEAPDEGVAGRDDHRYAVVSANFSRPFMAGAYPTYERAQLAQCGSPEKWLIYQRYTAHPSPPPAAETRKVSGFPVGGDPVQQMTGLTVADALDDPVSSLEILRGLTTSRTLCVWADGTYRVVPTMDVPVARDEEGTLIGVVPLAETGEVAPPAADDRIAELETQLREISSLREEIFRVILNEGGVMVAPGEEPDAVRRIIARAADEDSVRIAVEALERIKGQPLYYERDTADGPRRRCPSCAHAWPVASPEHHAPGCTRIIASEALAALKSTAAKEGEKS